MIMTVTEQNLKSLISVATQLQELCDELTFIGGCVTGLLITDMAAPVYDRPSMSIALLM